MGWVEGFLVRYPELTLFLVIAIGYWIGAIKVAGFNLGPVTGSLFAGILVGQIADVPVSPMAKSFLFLLFLFGIGYSVGPQFMQALKRDGFKPVALAIVVCVTGLLTAVAVAKFLGLDPGLAAGLTSGGLTESPAMGTATEAINALPISEAERARFVAHIAVADAVCYIFGAAGVIIFCSTVAPKLLHVDLALEARKLEKELGIVRTTPGIVSAWRQFELRAYRIVPGMPIVGKTVAAAEAGTGEHRLFIHRVRRDGQIIEVGADFVIAAGDVVALSGRREVLVNLVGQRGEEVEDHDLLDMPVAIVDVLLTSKDYAGKTLSELAQGPDSRGLFLRGIKRGGQEMPVAPNFALERGDIVRLLGPEQEVARAAKRMGPIVAPSEATDFVVLGFGIFLGGLIGILVTFPIGNMNISLSTSVGTLLVGLAVGHMRTRHPLFGRIPDGAIALMNALGLAAFVAMTGLHAGPIFIEAVAQVGVGLLIGGAIVTIVPQLVGLLFGHFVLRMNPLLLLGGLAGAQTMTPAMAAVQEKSGSSVAVLGYTPCVPIGHILLTTWGTVIVNIMAA